MIVAALLLLNLMLFAAVLWVWLDVRHLLRGIKLFARIAEQHGGMTDRQTARAESIVEQAKEVVAGKLTQNHTAETHIIDEVRQVPGRTAVEVLQKMKDSSGSGIVPPSELKP